MRPTKNAEITKRRRSIRLQGYDYSSAGAYFVTICTKDRECLFGDVVDAQMVLNGFGEIARSEWLLTAELRSNVVIDEFVIMPNHLHGNLVLRNWDDVEAHCNVPLPDVPQTEKFGKSTVNSIPTIIKLFKSTVAKQINELRGTPGKPVWQRNYYERVIRDEDELNRIREYIIYNPAKWEEDKDNPKNWG